jgi:hypothetical protein
MHNSASYNYASAHEHSGQQLHRDESSALLQSQEATLPSDRIFEEQLDQFLKEYYGTNPREATEAYSSGATASDCFPDASPEGLWENNHSTSLGTHTSAAGPSQLPGHTNMHAFEQHQNTRMHENMIFLWSMLPDNIE